MGYSAQTTRENNNYLSFANIPRGFIASSENIPSEPSNLPFEFNTNG